MRFGRERDCEYSEKDQKSRTEVLEEKIAALQARVRELEGGGGISASESGGGLAPWPAHPDDFDFSGLAVTSNVAGHAAEHYGSSPGMRLPFA